MIGRSAEDTNQITLNGILCTIALVNVRSKVWCACAGMRSEFLENPEPTFDPFHPSDSERTSFIVTILLTFLVGSQKCTQFCRDRNIQITLKYLY